MSRSVKAVVSTLLAVVIAFSVLAIPACADTVVPHYGVYTVLGDSNASGFGLSEYIAQAPNRINDGNLIGSSYAAMVANAVSADTVNMCAHSGWRTDEFLYLVNGALYPEYDDYMFTALGYDRNVNYDEWSGKIKSSIAAANLITVDFGSNDILTFALRRMVLLHPDLLGEIAMPDLSSVTDFNSLLEQVLVAAAAAGKLAELVHELEVIIGENLESFKANMPKVIGEIRALNPSAKIVVVGTFNPANISYTTSNGVFLSLLSTIDILMGAANCYLRYECPARGEYTYVDVTNTQTYNAGVVDAQALINGEEAGTISLIRMLHADEQGHAYKASRLIEALTIEVVAAPVVTAKKTSVLKKVVLSWDKIPGAVMYRIYRCSSENGDYYYIGSTATNLFYDGLTLRGKYYYKVCAVMDYTNGIYSDMSAPVCAA